MNTYPHNSIVSWIAVTCFFALTLNVSAASYSFNGAVDNDYKKAGNWSGSVIPDTANGDTAVISNGAAVTYDPTSTPAGDYTISNGGTLQVTNGSWTQITGGAWIQLGAGGAGGNGHILVNGGSFSQGTAGNNPFNISGTGNTFTITSGSAAFTSQVNAVTGITWNIAGGSTSMSAGPLNVQSGGNVLVSAGTLTLGGNLVLENGSTWTQTGGTVTLGSGAEFDFNSLSGSSMSGGTLNVDKLITGVNGSLGSTFGFSGGTINIGATAFSGMYGADNGNHPFNFTLGSLGVINFLNGNTSVSDVNGWLAAGGILYNNTTAPSAFLVSQAGGPGTTVSLSLVAAVPEPASYACLMGGVAAIAAVIYRRRR